MIRTLLAGTVLLIAFGAVAAADTPVDPAAKQVASADSRRVVAVGGSVTEIVYALGLEDRLVAVDSSSLYPAAVGALPNVGYMRQLSAESILALDPQLVLAIEDSGPLTALDQLRDAGVPVVQVPDSPSPRGVIEKIRIVAAALGVDEAGTRLAERVEAQLSVVEQAFGDVDERPRVLFLLSVGNGRIPLAAGRETSAAGIIELAGGVNVFDDFESYKPLSPEAAVAGAPDVLLITGRSLGLLGGMESLLEIPEIALTPAGRNGRVVTMDSLLLLGFGPRTAEAAASLGKQLHPAVILPDAVR